MNVIPGFLKNNWVVCSLKANFYIFDMVVTFLPKSHVVVCSLWF